MTVESNYAIAIPRHSEVIGLNFSRQFLNQWEAKPKPKPIGPCAPYLAALLSKFQVTALKSDSTLFARDVIGLINMLFDSFFDSHLKTALISHSFNVDFLYFLVFCR